MSATSKTPLDKPTRHGSCSNTTHAMAGGVEDEPPSYAGNFRDGQAYEGCSTHGMPQPNVADIAMPLALYFLPYHPP